ncbi:hypothetical protein Tco_0816447 [Tanacetum coccineum]
MSEGYLHPKESFRDPLVSRHRMHKISNRCFCERTCSQGLYESYDCVLVVLLETKENHIVFVLFPHGPGTKYYVSKIAVHSGSFRISDSNFHQDHLDVMERREHHEYSTLKLRPLDVEEGRLYLNERAMNEDHSTKYLLS